MEITDAISPLINEGHKVVLHRVEGWWKDTGTPEDILEANHLILDGVSIHGGCIERREMPSSPRSILFLESLSDFLIGPLRMGKMPKITSANGLLPKEEGIVVVKNTMIRLWS